MSRIGIKPVEVPKQVKVSLSEGTMLVEGPKGKVRQRIHPDMKVRVEGDRIVVERPSDSRLHRALHGTTRVLIKNAVHGVVNGYSRSLTINGVGYNAKVQGRELTINLGFSHPVKMAIPEGLTVTCPSPTVIEVTGPDRQLVGQFSAVIRSKRPPEPYNLKGIKYTDEVIKKKAGTTFVSGG
jgi:large subunit ribosomal protein L6